MSYYITSFCYGQKYAPIKDIWCNRISNKCKNSQIVVFENINVLNNQLFNPNFPGYIWAIRFIPLKILELVKMGQKTT